MRILTRWSAADLAELPQDRGLRYEIIDGELYVSVHPSVTHQHVCGRLISALCAWSRAWGLGTCVGGPGLVLAPDQEVIPDVVWISHGRFAGALDQDGHLTRTPELVVEVTSPGRTNAFRDREAKRDLYSRQGVDEYWIVDPLAQTVDVYRQQGGTLVPLAALTRQDTLTSPLLPGFACVVGTLFAGGLDIPMAGV
jgi:Uma2 family endonuclease